jgi:hypothetical protein
MTGLSIFSRFRAENPKLAHLSDDQVIDLIHRQSGMTREAFDEQIVPQLFTMALSPEKKRLNDLEAELATAKGSRAVELAAELIQNQRASGALAQEDDEENV